MGQLVRVVGNKNMKKVTVIHAKYTHSKSQKTIKNNDYLSLRYWQSEMFHSMKDSKYNIIVAPTGSGKTVAIETLIVHYLRNNPGHKTIIVVPQNNIGLGYGDNKFILDEEKISVKIPKRNFRVSSLGNVERLKNFIEEEVDDDDISSRLLVCTHASLVRFHKKLSDKDFKKLFKNCQLWIDESHHIQTTKIDSNYKFNKLSGVIHSFLENNYSVNAVTATFFRGDGHGFLKECHKEKFLAYKHTYANYFNDDCFYLKSVKLHIILYENNIYDSVCDIYKKRQVPTIIYLPYVQSTICGRDCKAARVKKLTEMLTAINKNIKIVDLVTPKTQKENSKYIHEQNKIAKKFLRGESTKKPEIDVIIALNIFKEGSDYLPLENVIMMGKHNSTVEVMQRAGRAMRDYPTKKEACIYAVLPGYSQKITSQDEVREIINENFKFFNLTMTLNDIFYPDPKEINGSNVEPEIKQHLKNVLWEKYFGETFRDVKKRILDDIPYVVSDNISPQDQWEELEKHCNEILKEKGVSNKKDREKMFKSLQANFIVSNLLFDPSRKFEKVSLDLIQKISPHDNYIFFSSRAFNIRTVAGFRKKLIDSALFIEESNFIIASVYAQRLAEVGRLTQIKKYESFKEKFDTSSINQYEEREKLNKIIKNSMVK